jgi:hypothetical protein
MVRVDASSAPRSYCCTVHRYALIFLQPASGCDYVMPPLGSNKKGLIKFFLAYFGDGEGSAGAVVVYESIHQHERDKCVSIEDFLDLFYD